MTASHESNHPLSFSGEIKMETGVILNKCYQCGKCSAGCPLGGEMDYPPSLVMRMLQTEDPAQYQKLLASMSIWLCISCEMCLTRCPMEIDIPTLMDYLRQESVAAKCDYVKTHGLAGLFVWRMDNDMRPDNSPPTYQVTGWMSGCLAG